MPLTSWAWRALVRNSGKSWSTWAVCLLTSWLKKNNRDVSSENPRHKPTAINMNTLKLHLHTCTALCQSEEVANFAWIHNRAIACADPFDQFRQSKYTSGSVHLGVTETVWTKVRMEVRVTVFFFLLHKCGITLFKCNHSADCVFLSCTCLHDRPYSDQMFLCKPPWIAHIVSNCWCTL